MAFPDGITTCQLIWGKNFQIDSSYLGATVTVTPSQALVWDATGDRLEPMSVKITTDGNTFGQLAVPHVDQSGWRDASATDTEVKNWHYVVSVRPKGSQKDYVKIISPVQGQTTIDVEKVKDGPAQLPAMGTVPPVTSVNGQTGAVLVPGATDAEVAEFVSGDGPTAAALTATIASGVETTGGDLFEKQRKRQLQHFWAALANNNATVTIPGDSWVEGARGSDLPFIRWVDWITNAIRAAAPQTLGGQYIPSYSTYPTKLPYNWAFTGTTTQKQNTGPGMYNVEMAVGATAMLTFRGTGIRMHMDRRTDGATVTVVIDGVTVETYNSQNASLSTSEYRTYAGLQPGAHTVVISVTAATGTIFSLQGAYCFNTDETSGVRVYPAGRGGITADTYNNNGGWSVLSATVPDLIIQGLGGINDYRSAITPAQFQADLEAMETFIAARTPLQPATVIYLKYPQTALGATPAVADWEEYRAAVDAVAANHDRFVVDLANAFPPGQLDSTVTALAYSDNVHPSDAGQLAIAQYIAESILPPQAVRNIRRQVTQERQFLAASQMDVNTGAAAASVYALINSSLFGFRLAHGTQNGVIAPLRLPSEWQTAALDLEYMNFSTGAGNVRIKVRVKAVPMGSGVSVPQNVTNTAAVKGQYIGDRYQSFLTFSNDPDTNLYLEITRMGDDALDTLSNDIVLTGVMIRRLS